jgi:hypothetical protein
LTRSSFSREVCVIIVDYPNGVRFMGTIVQIRLGLKRRR